MANTIYTAVVILPIIAYVVYIQLYNWRFKKYKDFPQLQNSLLIGHLPHIAKGFKKLGDARRHIGTTSTPKSYLY